MSTNTGCTAKPSFLLVNDVHRGLVHMAGLNSDLLHTFDTFLWLFFSNVTYI